VIHLSSTGYIRVHVYTSDAKLPLKDAAVSVTDPNGYPIALRLTDRSGFIDPVAVTVPDRAASQSPSAGIVPFTSVNIYARLEDYQQIEVENVQVFPNIVTTQNLPLIPLSELPGAWNKTEIFRTTPQNL
jgi:hypothetical protein